MACATVALPSAAADLRPGGVFVQGGTGDHSLRAGTVGVVWPWAWQRPLGSGQIAGYTEAYLSRWSAKDTNGRASFNQIAVVPMLRFRPDAGRSPWFLEGGIGLSYMDRLFAAQDKRFSTRFNFADTLGLGRSFGEQNRHELSLRLTHYSNGGIKHPNPGQNVIGLRYGYMF